MITANTIKSFCDQIVQHFEPVKVVLFGSYASGKPSPDSDVDILVIVPHKGISAGKAAEILTKLDPKFPIDLMVRSPGKIKERLEPGDFFIREIMEKGKVLYEAPDKGMGAKGGRRLRNRAA